MICEVCKKRESYRAMVTPNDEVKELCQLCDIALTAKIVKFIYSRQEAKTIITKYIRRVLGKCHTKIKN